VGEKSFSIYSPLMSSVESELPPVSLIWKGKEQNHLQVLMSMIRFNQACCSEVIWPIVRLMGGET